MVETRTVLRGPCVDPLRIPTSVLRWQELRVSGRVDDGTILQCCDGKSSELVAELMMEPSFSVAMARAQS
jgi:hypothetical protein